MVVIRIPMVALIRGEGSPILFRHSALMKDDTSGGNFSKWALTLFFNIKPLSDLVGSSEIEESANFQFNFLYVTRVISIPF